MQSPHDFCFISLSSRLLLEVHRFLSIWDDLWTYFGSLQQVINSYGKCYNFLKVFSSVVKYIKESVTSVKKKNKLASKQRGKFSNNNIFLHPSVDPKFSPENGWNSSQLPSPRYHPIQLQPGGNGVEVECEMGWKFRFENPRTHAAHPFPVDWRSQPSSRGRPKVTGEKRRENKKNGNPVSARDIHSVLPSPSLVGREDEMIL